MTRTNGMKKEDRPSALIWEWPLSGYSESSSIAPSAPSRQCHAANGLLVASCLTFSGVVFRDSDGRAPIESRVCEPCGAGLTWASAVQTASAASLGYGIGFPTRISISKDGCADRRTPANHFGNPLALAVSGGQRQHGNDATLSTMRIIPARYQTAEPPLTARCRLVPSSVRRPPPGPSDREGARSSPRRQGSSSEVLLHALQEAAGRCAENERIWRTTRARPGSFHGTCSLRPSARASSFHGHGKVRRDIIRQDQWASALATKSRVW